MGSNILSIINKKKKTLKDKDVFLSYKMTSYLKQKAAKVHEHFKVKESSLLLIHEPALNTVAYTDNMKYLINIAHPIFKGNREDKLAKICGVLLHEIGHRLFTSFSVSTMYTNSILNGKLAFTSSDLSGTQATTLAEIEEYIKTPKKAKLLSVTIDTLDNILEDGRIEYLLLSYCKQFYTLHHGLEVLRDYHFKTLPSYEQLRIDFELSERVIDTLFQTILSYAKFGEIKDLNYNEHRYDDLAETLDGVLEYIDNCIESTNTAEYYRNLNFVVIELWKYIKLHLESLEKEDDENGEGDGESALQNLQDSLSSIKGLFNEEVSSSLSSNEEKNMSKLLQNGAANQEAPEKEGQDASQEESEEADDEGEQGASSISSEGNDNGEKQGTPAKPPFTRNTSMTCIGSGKITVEVDDSDRIISLAEKEAVQTKITKEQEDAMHKAINDAKDLMDFGEFHKNVDCTIIRQEVKPADIDEYKIISPPLLDIAKKMAKKTDFFTEEENPVKFRNRYYGKRFHAESVARQDYRNFSQNVNLEEAPSLAVGVVIDESGSMSGSKSSIAKKMAIMLYEYCKIMNVAVSIYGHSTSGNKVNLFPYTDFEENFPNDCYRLTRISSRGANRDGYALRFMYNRLINQDADNKMLIIVSDGAPAHTGGYTGSGAFADLADFTKMCEKNDVLLLAAAIDDDKEDIMAAYGKNHFLDITNLDALPVKMTSVIKSMLK